MSRSQSPLDVSAKTRDLLDLQQVWKKTEAMEGEMKATRTADSMTVRI